ncbi:hypothetical protein HMPREF1545_00889 [Oscillibacter sp. KLE 1728]|nr:hypothetical protein HMPREF1545_00889 [Oscillibacter sp. KLE 1728]
MNCSLGTTMRLPTRSVGKSDRASAHIRWTPTLPEPVPPFLH